MADSNHGKAEPGRKPNSGDHNASLKPPGAAHPPPGWLKHADTLTPTDLALVAANIGTGLDNPDKLASRALELWQACAKAVDGWPALRLAQTCASPPQPSFPVDIDTFLELMLPEQSKSERIAVLRTFLDDHYRFGGDRRKIDEFQRHWDSPISESGYYQYMRRAFLFREWFKVYQATKQWITARLESVPAAERAEIADYLEEQAAAGRRQSCDEASNAWEKFTDKILPPLAPCFAGEHVWPQRRIGRKILNG